jgi:hypothetical protein
MIALGLEGISRKSWTRLIGPSKSWIKVKNPKAPAATHETTASRAVNEVSACEKVLT